MSADVWIDSDPCPTCGGRPERADVNITYNLSTMLAEAGFCGWSDLLGKPAAEAGRHILDVLDRMQTDPDRWRAMNPKNGWGDYDSCLQDRLRKFADVCVTATGPSARIGGWL